MNEELKKWIVKLSIPVVCAAIITIVAALLDKWGMLFLGALIGILIGQLIKN
jgi:hypothetical protein